MNALLLALVFLVSVDYRVTLLSAEGKPVRTWIAREKPRQSGDQICFLERQPKAKPFQARRERETCIPAERALVEQVDRKPEPFESRN